MRHTALLALLTLGAACAGSSSGGSASAPAPAGTPATTAAAPAGANPCEPGTCTVDVEVASEVASPFQRSSANFKIYQGCPRTFAVSDSSQLRGIVPIVASSSPHIPVPGGLKGNFATVAIFFGAQPQRYVVVDFSKKLAQSVDFGYQWDGNKYTNNLNVTGPNKSYMAKVCR